MTNVLFEIAASLFDSVLCICFITQFNGVSFKKNKYILPAIGVYFILTLISDKFLGGFNVLTSLILLALSCAYALCISPRTPIKAILSACIYKVAFILLSSVLYLVISIMINDFDLLMHGSAFIGRYIYIILHKISLFAVLELFSHIFQSKTFTNIKNGILNFLFTLTTIIGLGATMFFTTLSNASEIQTQILIVVISFIAANIFLYILISQVQKLQKSKYELKLLEEKMNYEKDRYNDATAIWTNIKKVQHDMKQHLTVIDGYLKENEIEPCRGYIHKLLPTVNQTEGLIKSDNTILDYLINSKLGALKDTQVIISGTIGNLSDIKDLDLACLMGNILDNAVEAIENVTDKRIELYFAMQNSNRVIICKNTVASPVLETNKELRSTKNSGSAHGYGHLIIAKIVSDYHGMIDYFEESNMFGVQIVLPILDRKA